MNALSDIDRLILDWLEEPGPIDPPDRVIEAAIAIAAQRRQRRIRLPLLDRDFPMQTHLRVVRSPAASWLIVAAALIALAIGAVLVAGALRNRVPAPFGLARPGAIVFETSGHVMLANRDGTGQRALTAGSDRDSFPVFSPDGTHVAFWRRAGVDLAVMVVTKDGDQPVAIPLPSGAEPGNAAAQVAWAPSSDHLAFAITVAPQSIPHIWTVGADGANLTQRGGSSAFADDPAWSPDGHAIAFHGGGEGPANGLYVMSADGSDPHRISSVAGSSFAFHTPEWRPQGDLIAFYAGDDGAHNVYVIGPDGIGERNVSSDDPRRGARPTDEYWPSWSPDGARLAFTRNNVRDQAHPWFYDVMIVVDPDGSHATTLDPGRSIQLDPGSRLDRSQPIWSPDSTAIAGFLFNDARGDYALIVFDARRGHVLSTIDTAGATGLLSWQRLAP